MDAKDRKFYQEVDRILRESGRSMKGIRLRCRKCGGHALTRSVKLAELFGWAELVHVRGPDYEGLCIDCAP